MVNVLVPMDGSPPSWTALDHAASIVDDGTITVLHVVDPMSIMYSGDEEGYYDPGSYERARERGEDLLEEVREHLVSEGALESTEFRDVIEVGRPSTTIVEYVEDHNVDHVVMGSHGRTGVSRLLLGSVAETVVRRIPVPVTIIR
ncbi:MAG: universal stress protein [Natronomonas sp.]